jgi:hypothetical protein
MRNRALGGCLIALAIMAVAALWARAEQAKPSEPNKDSPWAAQSEAPSEKSVEESRSPKQIVAPDDKKSTKEHQANTDTNNYEWLKKIFGELKITDILLTFFTGALAIYTYRLWRSTEKLWGAGEKQIAVAKESADAARGSVKLAEEIAKRQLRAYVHIDAVELEGNSIRIKIKNFGTTPAYRVKHNNSSKIVLVGESNFKLAMEGRSIELGPGQEYTSINQSISRFTFRRRI